MMKLAELDRQISERFLLEPAITARGQEAYFRLSLSPVATLVVELVELYRDQIIRRQATEELLNSDYRSRRQMELERRAFEAEEEGRRCWVLGMKHQARKHWGRADRLWKKVDKMVKGEKIQFRAWAAIKHAPHGRKLVA